MKNLCFYFFILICLESSGQIDLKVECSPNNVKSKNDLNFILSISNSSHQPIGVTKIITELPKGNTDADVWYEILYFDKLDSVDITSSIRTHIQKRRTNDLPIELEPGASFYFKADVINGYFDKPGKYKLRFMLRKEMFDALKEDIYSNWIYLNINKDISHE